MIWGRSPSLETASLCCNLRTDKGGIGDLHLDINPIHTLISSFLGSDSVMVASVHKALTSVNIKIAYTGVGIHMIPIRLI